MAEGGSTGQAWSDDAASGDVFAAHFSQDGRHKEKEAGCHIVRVSEMVPTNCG